MEPSPDPPAGEVALLRRCLNDLISVTALPPLWANAEPPQIVGTLLDALREMLGLAFVFVRLKDPAGGPTVDLVRVGRPLGPDAGAPEIGEMLDASFGAEPSRWPPSARLPVGGDDVCLASARLGLQAEFGVVVAACRRPDFPAPTERLLFDVAANHAALGLQQAYLRRRGARSRRQSDPRQVEVGAADRVPQPDEHEREPEHLAERVQQRADDPRRLGVRPERRERCDAHEIVETPS